MEQSIQQIAKDLSLKLEALEEGMLSMDDVAPLVDDAREVYERLIALRYAAIERAVKGDQADEIDHTDGADDDRVAFRIGDVLPGQTSLIDAIEEIQRENGHAHPSDEEVDDAVTEEEIAEPAVAVIAPEPVSQPPVIPQNEAKPAKEEPVVPATQAPTATESAHPSPQKNQQQGDKTIADRLRRTPIQDLRKAIGINQRFQFLNDLFSGDNERYVRTVDEVNSANSLAAALTILAAVNERLAQPDDDDAVAHALLQLVERRFL
ncbi:MAG: hypothetical protein ACFCUH_07665 [Flavobacteriales bacterium]